MTHRQSPLVLVTGATDGIGKETALETGRYFSNRREAQMNPVAKDRDFCRRFYEKSAELAGIPGLPLPGE